jgi:hypothetical protein
MIMFHGGTKGIFALGLYDTEENTEHRFCLVRLRRVCQPTKGDLQSTCTNLGRGIWGHVPLHMRSSIRAEGTNYDQRLIRCIAFRCCRILCTRYAAADSSQSIGDEKWQTQSS